MTAAKTHIALVVKDVVKSTDFYTKLFGAQPHKVRSGYANFDLESPGLKLALLEGTGVFGALRAPLAQVTRIGGGRPARGQKDQPVLGFALQPVLGCRLRE